MTYSTQSSSKKQFENIDGYRIPKEKKIAKASPTRSIAKSVSWRIVASVTTFVIMYISTDGNVNVELIGLIVGADAIVKMIIYYFHERVWENIRWGKYWMKYGLIRRIKLTYIQFKRRKLRR